MLYEQIAIGEIDPATTKPYPHEQWVSATGEQLMQAPQKRKANHSSIMNTAAATAEDLEITDTS